MRIAPEGKGIITAGLLLSVAGWISFVLFSKLAIFPALFFTVIALGLLFFFRDPIVNIEVNDNNMLAPAEGKVLPIGEYTDESGVTFRMISIFLSIFNVHVNRSAVSGTVVKLEYRPGKYHIAFRHAAASENEMNRITVNCAFGVVIMQQVTGFVARRVVCHLKEGQIVKAGDRIGMMKFGSRMDLIIPDNMEIKVKPGDKVSAGRTIIGVWINE